ncbi:hypothetical protein MAPG_03129 [Magnaporthiopsis poae ATCC 64411]|uniref:Uncharacterized protein n=1 Tax=Magnaporthiopsis poae (strain ATCC 64411 / 73-15) TaxID=644358 RepID=A0A0C4DT70_MAGP6|nr:hypothetical protein MAPG_03129 [Magnaporthiopsis poae ATCC 64411]
MCADQSRSLYTALCPLWARISRSPVIQLAHAIGGELGRTGQANETDETAQHQQAFTDCSSISFGISFGINNLGARGIFASSPTPRLISPVPAKAVILSFSPCGNQVLDIGQPAPVQLQLVVFRYLSTLAAEFTITY